MIEPKSNNFYLVQTIFPSKLIESEGNKYKFKNLFNEQIFETDLNNFREIELKQEHFEKIGFKNYKLQNLYFKPLTVVLGNDLINLRVEFYGYLIFVKEDLVSTQKKFNATLAEVYNSYEENPNNIHNLRSKFRQDFGGISYLNELFSILEKYNIDLENKEEVALQ